MLFCVTKTILLLLPCSRFLPLPLRFLKKMAQTGGGPARGTKRTRETDGKNKSVGAAAAMLQFYRHDAAGFKVSPVVVICMSIGFIVCVVILHALSKF